MELERALLWIDRSSRDLGLERQGWQADRVDSPERATAAFCRLVQRAIV